MSETEESDFSSDSSAEEVHLSAQSSDLETSDGEEIMDTIQAVLPHVSAIRVAKCGDSSSDEEGVSSDSDDEQDPSSSCDESNNESSSTESLRHFQRKKKTRVDTDSDCWISSSESATLIRQTYMPKDIFHPEFQPVDIKTTKKRGRPPKKSSLLSAAEKPSKMIVKLTELAPDRKHYPYQEEVLAELIRLEAIRKQERAANRLKKKAELLPAVLADVISPVAAVKGKSEGETLDVPVIPMPSTIEQNLVVPQIQKKARGRPRTRFFDINRVKRPRGRPRKIKTDEDLKPKECKKRGRPPKPKTVEDLLPKIPKKRGRKPKGHWEVTDQTPPKPKKPKLDYVYDSTKEVDQNKLLLMMNLGVRVVDINEPNACHVRKRGRPRKGEERPPPPPKGPPKKRGRKKKEVDPNEAERKLLAKAERMKAREHCRQQKRQRALQEKQARREQREMKRRERQELKSQQGKKKRGRRPKEDFQFVEGEMQPHKQNNDAKALEKVRAKLKPASHVPAYKSRRLLSCCYCQQWSWDLLRCTNCMRSQEYNTRTVIVEEHEVITEALDKSRPFYHPPPVPYYRPGRVVFCTGCFYYSSDMKNCSECEAPIPEYSRVVFVDFENNPECLEKPGTFFATFKPRAVDDRLLECPFCELTLLRSARHCPHCKHSLPRQISIVPDLESGGPPEWPTPQMLKQGTVTEMPDFYEPIYREKTVTMCRWCCTVVWDLNRCKSCFRKLPTTSDLMEDGPTYDFAEGKQAERPVFDPKPFPYLRPGVSVLCPECGEYSKDRKNCDNCGKRLTNRSYVTVCFKKVSKPPADSQVLPFVARKVNVAFMLCPHCEFSYMKQESHCTHCHKRNPKCVTIVPCSIDMDKACNEQTFNKLNSIFHCQTLAILGAEDKNQEDLRQQEKPRLSHSAHYVPRFRERGVAQCPTCLGWTWDMDRCSLCFVPMMVNIRKPPLIIYPKPGAIRDVVIEKLRPKFAKTPLPYLRPGRLTLCQCCGCYTQGPPFCTECGRLIAQHPVYVNIDFSGQYAKVPPGCRKLPYQPRLTMDDELALCPFCGYTTENFNLCSFCQQEIPSHVLLIPENPDVDSFQVLDELLEKNQPKLTVLALKRVPPPKELPQNIIKLPPPVKVSGVEIPIFIMPPGVTSTPKPPPAKVPKPTNLPLGLGAFNFVSHVDSKTYKLLQVLAAKNLISTQTIPTCTITSAEASDVVSPKSVLTGNSFDSAVAATSGTCSPDLTNVATTSVTWYTVETTSGTFNTDMTATSGTFSPDLANVATTSGTFNPDMTATSGTFSPDLTNVATTSGTFNTDMTATSGTFSPDLANVATTSDTFNPDMTATSGTFSPDTTKVATTSDTFNPNMTATSGTFSPDLTNVATTSGTFYPDMTATSRTFSPDLSNVATTSDTFNPNMTATSGTFSPDLVPPGCRKLPYQPRLTMDDELALCPFCGYTTENFNLCPFCQQEIPSHVLPIPENPDVDSFQVLDELLEKNQPKLTVLALKRVPPPKELPQNIIKLPPPVKVSGVEIPIFIMPPGVTSTPKPPPAKVPKPTNLPLGLGAFNFVSHVDSKTYKLLQVLAAKNLISTQTIPTCTITSAEASDVVSPKSVLTGNSFDSAVAATSGTCSPDLTNVATTSVTWYTVETTSGTFNTDMTATSGTFSPDLANVATTSGTFNPDMTATSGTFSPDLTNVATTSGTFNPDMTATSGTFSPDLTNVATTSGTFNTDMTATSGTFSPDLTNVATTSGTFNPNMSATSGTFSPDLTNVATTSGTFYPDMTATSRTFSPDLSNVATTSDTFNPNMTATSGTFSPDLTNVATTSGTFYPDVATSNVL